MTDQIGIRLYQQQQQGGPATGLTIEGIDVPEDAQGPNFRLDADPGQLHIAWSREQMEALREGIGQLLDCDEDQEFYLIV